MADKCLVVRGNAALCERELKVEHKKMSNKKKKNGAISNCLPGLTSTTQTKEKDVCVSTCVSFEEIKKKDTHAKKENKRKGNIEKQKHKEGEGTEIHITP